MNSADARLLDMLRRGDAVTFTRHDGPATLVLSEPRPVAAPAPPPTPTPAPSRLVARRRAWQERMSELLTGRRHE
jgi:hypothetical protein